VSYRSRVRNAIVALVPVIVLAGTAPAQDSLKGGGTGVSKGTSGAKEIALSVSPKGAPMPLFRHRLLPMASRLNPGDAAPIYLRLGYELPDGALREADRKATAWLALPFDEFPAPEARALADRWSPQLRQIEFGSRRRTCDWNYTLPEEKDHALSIRLPDAQAMRVWGRLLAVKARSEIAQGKYEDAIRTIETGLAFGRHVAETPFFINVLVGMAIANLMLDRVDELAGRPGAPNLYWALTALPRPLISTRNAAEGEWLVSEWLVPEVTEVDRPRTDGEWADLLARLHARLVALEKLLWPDGRWGDATPAELGAFKAAMLPKARGYIEARKVEARSDDQALVLAIVGSYRELYDDYFKCAYLPYPDAVALEPEADRRVIAAKSGPAAVFAGLLPATQSVHMAEVRLDRKVAALRAVEALRIHLAARGGRLPESLGLVKEVPIPADPMTGKPFEYRLEGESALLTGPAPAAFRLAYRITVRE
jgi:hypothetical protein